jgi:hypothetical protein
MADFSVPFVNQVSKAKDDQEQARASQQIMQVAQLAMYQQRLKDQEDDRELKSYGMILAHPEFGDEVHLQAVNHMMQKLKIPGEVTMDGLKPLSGLMRTMMDDYAKLGDKMDWDKYGPAIDMITANPRYIMQKQLAELPTLQDAQRGAQANRAVEWANPGTPTGVAESRTWLESHKSELADLGGDNKKRLEETVKRGEPNAAATAQEQLARLAQLEDEQKFHEAVVNEDVARGNLNKQVASWAKTHPDAIKILEKHGLQGLGIYPTDDNFIKSEYNRLLQKPTLTSDEQRKLDGYMKYILGKSGESMRAAGEVARITEKQTQYRAEGQMIEEVRKSDQHGQEGAEQFRTTMSAFMEGIQDPNQTAEQWQTRQAEARGMSMMLGDQQQARMRENQPKVEQLMQEQERLQEDIAALRKRIPTTPAAGRDALREELHAKEDILRARGAEANLLSEYDPLKGVDMEWQRAIHRQEADHLKSALSQGSLTDEERTKLQSDADAAESAAQAAEVQHKKWTGERNTHLATLTTVQGSMDRASRALDLKKTATMHLIEKEEKTTGLFQAVVTDMAADRDLSFTQAVSRNLKDYKGADLKTLKAEVDGFFKHDYDNAVRYGQHVLTGLIAAHGAKTHRNELTPVEAADLAHQAGEITQKHTKILVSEDDLLKVNEKGKAGVTVNNIPAQDRTNALAAGHAYITGKWLTEKIDTALDRDPGSVGFLGMMKKFAGGISQQWAAAVSYESSLGKENWDAFKKTKFYNSATVDEVESAHKALVYAVARVTNPTGVLSDADAEAAEEIVGSVSSWRSGPQQIKNKMKFVREYMRMKAQLADRVAHATSLTELFDDNPIMGGREDEAPPAAPPGAPADGQPKTADEYFKKFQSGGAR